MKKTLFLLLTFFLFIETAQAQQLSMLSFEQLDSLQALEERPVLVFIHTDWCRYCEGMKQTTFRNEKVQDWIDSTFYLVSLDAEYAQTIEVQGQTFSFRPSGRDSGLHELATLLGSIDGKLTFPTLCFLNADYEIIYQQAGFVRAKELTKTMNIIHQNL